ncbi:MAG: YciI family protein [Nitrospira sp.]|nr:YciI family protein [Nitrospira sp.]
MKYLLLVHHNEDMFKTMPEGTRKDMLAESIQLCHQLAGKGQYVHASPMQPEATGAIVQVRDGKPMVTDGPFMETKEQLAGYFLIDAKDREEAIRIAVRVPGARIGTVEVRPVIEVSGLPDEKDKAKV